MQNSEQSHHPEELYTELSEPDEPDPDYQNEEDSTDLPPPPNSDELGRLASTLPSDNAPVSPSELTDTAPVLSSSSTGITIIGIKNGGISPEEEDAVQVRPRKLVNPCLESRERQALHKELLLNYKLGKDVLKKPELSRVLQKRKDNQKKKEWDEMKAGSRTSLEMKLEERANKLKEMDEPKMKPVKEEIVEQTPELLRMHRRITNKTQPSTS